MLFGILLHLQFGNFDVYAGRLIRPAFLNGLPDYLGIVLPESAFCHAVLEELLQIVGIGLGHPPVAVLMGLALRKEPQRRERDGSFYRFVRLMKDEMTDEQFLRCLLYTSPSPRDA